jgi:TldD protein
LKNVLYWSITPKFWRSLDAVTDERFWETYGLINCGKGEPVQWNQMTHPAPWARYRNINTGRSSR